MIRKMKFTTGREEGPTDDAAGTIAGWESQCTCCMNSAGDSRFLPVCVGRNFNTILHTPLFGIVK